MFGQEVEYHSFPLTGAPRTIMREKRRRERYVFIMSPRYFSTETDAAKQTEKLRTVPGINSAEVLQNRLMTL